MILLQDFGNLKSPAASRVVFQKTRIHRVQTCKVDCKRGGRISTVEGFRFNNSIRVWDWWNGKRVKEDSKAS